MYVCLLFMYQMQQKLMYLIIPFLDTSEKGIQIINSKKQNSIIKTAKF